MDDSGYVKFHRKTLSSWIIKDSVCFHMFFGWFLLRAAWQPYTTKVYGQVVNLEIGQVIGGRKMIADAFSLTEKQVRNGLVRLVRHGLIGASTRASTGASTFTVYNVINWGTYQQSDCEDGPALRAEVERLGAILKEVIKEVKETTGSKEGSKEKKKTGADALRENPLIFIDTFPEEFQASEPFREAWAKWVQHRKENGKPLHTLKTGSAESIRQLGALTPDHAAEVINHSLRNGWAGLFPDKVKEPPKRTKGGYILPRVAI